MTAATIAFRPAILNESSHGSIDFLRGVEWSLRSAILAPSRTATNTLIAQRSLLAAQRRCRVDAGGAECGERAGEDSEDQQHARGDRVCQRISGMHGIEKAREQPREGERRAAARDRTE